MNSKHHEVPAGYRGIIANDALQTKKQTKDVMENSGKKKKEQQRQWMEVYYIGSWRLVLMTFVSHAHIFVVINTEYKFGFYGKRKHNFDANTSVD